MDTERDRRRDQVARETTIPHQTGSEESQTTDATGEGLKSHKTEEAFAAPEADRQRQTRLIETTNSGSRDGSPPKRSSLVATTREVGVQPHPRVKW